MAQTEYIQPTGETTMLWIIVWTLAYISFGFCFGVFREKVGTWKAAWGYQRSHLQYAIAFFCFPGSILFEGSHWGGALALSGGGIPYWLILGVVWPLAIVWTILFAIILCVAIGVTAVIYGIEWLSIQTWKVFIESSRPFESRVRRFAGIVKG